MNIVKKKPHLHRVGRYRAQRQSRSSFARSVAAAIT
jgi:hypothetical protein